MTDIAVTEAPAELEDSSPVPEASAEVEAAPGVALQDADAAADNQAARVERAPGEIERPLISLRQAIIDHLTDTEEPQSVAQILAAMPAGTTRNTCEAAVKRCFDAGLIERVAPGRYQLAPQRPAPSEPPPELKPGPTDGLTSEQWFEVLEAWLLDASTWNTAELGPTPDSTDHRVPPDIITKFNDRQRKRLERQRDAEAAAAKREEADRALRDQLLEAIGGNFVEGPGVHDLAPIRLALTLVPIDYVLLAIKKFDPKVNLPDPEPLKTWRDPSLLKRIAEYYCRFVAIPSMVKAWSAAKAPQKPAGAPEASPALSY
jgi:hypothetical protein